jgi:hypothetical protein
VSLITSPHQFCFVGAPDTSFAVASADNKVESHFLDVFYKPPKLMSEASSYTDCQTISNVRLANKDVNCLLGD